MTKSYFAYVRISDPKQSDGTSLDVQPDDIARYADKHGLHISQWFEEKKSASKQGRRVFTDVVKRLKRGEAQGLIVHKIDRWSRNWFDWAMVHELRDAGIEVHFVVDNIDFDTLGGQLTGDLMAAISNHYSRNLSFEALKGLNARLNQGLYPFAAPIGYINTGGGNPKTICPKKGPLVKKLFEKYATSEYSIVSLTKEANRIGLRNSNGGKVSKTCIEKMLKNPFYIGKIYVWSRRERYDGIHEPLISARLFQSVKEIRENRTVKKVAKHDLTYRRSLNCAKCGRTFSGERQKGFVYYRCHTKGCTKGAIREEVIEDAVTAAIQNFEFSSDQLNSLSKRVQSWKSSVLKIEQTGFKAEALEDVKQKMDHLLDAYLEKLIDKDTFEKRQAQLLLSEQVISEEMENYISHEQIKQSLLDMFERLKNLSQSYFWANSAEKRQMLKILFSNCKINGKNVELEPKEWMRKATEMVTNLLGGPNGGRIRTSVIDRFMENPDQNEVLHCEEWKQFRQLHNQIVVRQRHERVTETETGPSYDEAA